MGIVATLEELLALGVDVAPFIAKLAATFKAGAPAPTEADLAALRAAETAMSAQIQAPVPDPQP